MEEAPVSAPLSTVAPTVLVVDDEKNIRRTLEMVLSGEGYRVLEAESAEQALSLLGGGAGPVDLAIFDLKLPGMSGLSALEKVRSDEATRELPVIVISGHATVHDAVAAIKLGASDFFEKPLNRERVLVSVTNSIRTARLSRVVAHTSVRSHCARSAVRERAMSAARASGVSSERAAVAASTHGV